MNLSINTIAGTDFEGGGLIDPAQASADKDHFAELLKRAKEGAGEDKIREAAEQLVSATFIMPVLSSVRESSMAAEPFAPTPAEKQFGTLLDQRIADEIVKSSSLPIVDRLTANFGSRTQQPPAAQTLEVTG